MKIYRVEIPEAIQDKIEEQAFYIAQDKPAVAVKWYDDICDAIHTLDSMPSRCSLAPESQYIDDDIRHLVVGNYRVLFCVEEDVVLILDFKGSPQNKPTVC